MKTIIHTTSAPAPIGPYNQAVQCGNLLFSSGQIPIDPATGNLVAEDVALQTQQVLANLEQVLKAAGVGFENVIKTTVFLSDMKNFPAVNAVYAEAFGEEGAPARSTVEVAALPLGALVEIEAIADLS